MVGQAITLFHGTSRDSADALLSKGWSPSETGVSPGANQGRRGHLYLTTEPLDALWFAEQKGEQTVLSVTVAIEDLIVDPEDGIGETVLDEMSQTSGLPGKLATKRPLSPAAFQIFEFPPAPRR